MSRTVKPDGFDAYFDAWESKIGAFLEYKAEAWKGTAGATPTPGAAGSSGALAGLPFAVKDNIAVKDFGLSCASKLLEGLRSPYTATAVAKLEATGAHVMGKTNMDEFGMGSSTDSSALKTTNNPWDPTKVAGGSSGGSAAAVAAGLVPFALGSDTGGSVRQPAAFCGVVGLKPTYGSVSRYGLVAYASSLETVGILADSAIRARSVFSIIRGVDEMDQTTQAFPPDADLLAALSGGLASPRKIGVLSATSLEAETEAGFQKAKAGLIKLGHTLVEIDLPSLKYASPAYYTIATAEASANLARFDSIRYGNRPDWAENPEELINKARGAGFGAEVKLRILLGTFVLRSGFQDRYYLRAQRIRDYIKRDFNRILSGPSKVDAILLPVFPTRAFGRGEEGLSSFAQKAADLYTCCANLAGLPALSFQASVEAGLPVGVQLVGPAFSEASLFDLVEAYEAAHPAQHPTGYKAFWS